MPILLQSSCFFFSWQRPIVVRPVDPLSPIAVTLGCICSLVGIALGVLGRREE